MPFVILKSPIAPREGESQGEWNRRITLEGYERRMWLETSEVAFILNVSRTTIVNRADRLNIGTRFTPHTRLFTHADVEALRPSKPGRPRRA